MSQFCFIDTCSRQNRSNVVNLACLQTTVAHSRLLYDKSFKVKDRVCFAPVFITYNKLYVPSKHFFAKLVLHRSSIINKIVINIMIIEVMYTAKSPHSFVDSRPRDDIDRIRSLACYTESVKHDGRPRMSTAMETIDAHADRRY